jgi:hypothetical protein
MQPNKIEHLMNLPKPAGGEKKETASGRAAAFSESLLGRADDRAFPETAQNEPGPCA